MNVEAFEIATLKKEGHDRWVVGGRAYVDVNLNQRLTTSSDDAEDLRVVGIVSYHKSTDLLSMMMTGTLTLEGQLPVGKDQPKFLYLAQEKNTKKARIKCKCHPFKNLFVYINEIFTSSQAHASNTTIPESGFG